jgi:hypothetical protein
MNLQYAKDPRWANAEQTLIDLTIKWDAIDEELPFTASPSDTEAHGRTIFAAALNGDFGPVADYVAPPEPEPLPPQVPASITMRQCRLQLHATGKLALVDQAIAALPEPQKTEAQIEWEYGSVVWRSSPLIAMLAPVLGWDTSEAIDQQFIEAAAR